MIYDLSNTLQQNHFKLRCNHLYKKAKVVELREVSSQRSLPQNSYLHLLLSYLAVSLGVSLAYAKDYYYKRVANAEIFSQKQVDKVTGEMVDYPRSSASLTTEEMSLSIDRLKIWASQEAGVYLPDATRPEEIAQAQAEVERQKQYL